MWSCINISLFLFVFWLYASILFLKINNTNIGGFFMSELSAADLNLLENNYRDLLQRVGEDINREGLVRTPHRAAKALSDFTKGYNQSITDVINGAIFESDNDEMIIVKDIIYCLFLEKFM